MIILELPDEDMQVICDGFLKVSPGPDNDDTGEPLHDDPIEQLKASIRNMVGEVTRQGLKRIALDNTPPAEDLPNSLLGE